MLTAEDIYLLGEGSHQTLYERMGARLVPGGVHFAVWAPNAREVSVIGDFNGWRPGAHPMQPHGTSGVWTTQIAGVGKGAHYKFHLRARDSEYAVEKADPFAIHAETPPKTASIVWDLHYTWHDQAWQEARFKRNSRQSPMSIYEVHLGSWMRMPEEGNRFLSYRELAPKLVRHVQNLGFTHVELMPVMEHPFYGSWGYQSTGYFAPSSRYGTPQDLMFLVDSLHQAGIGVILDWVPSHFPNDEHGLGYFDGTHLYEHADPRRGFHPDWKSFIFNYGRNEVRAFLVSSAAYWLDRYHVDGLRVDGVASMLYLDYSRREGEWIPNPFGGRENIDAIEFLRHMNGTLYARHPDTQMYAEESTAWPSVSRPASHGGLGFGFKWDMGWMHDSLRYIERDPVHRKHHHHELTFRSVYAFTENFVLPLSHDEVVHGKGSLLGKMPGDEWQRFAGLRLLYAYMWGQPGKKLLFMGGEFAQEREWDHDRSLDWHTAEHPYRQGMLRLVADLNSAYIASASLHELDCDGHGFEWAVVDDVENSVYIWLRKNHGNTEITLVACNFTPVPRYDYRVGVPKGGRWVEMLNTDSEIYGGTGVGNLGGVEAMTSPAHGRSHQLALTLPPLGAVFMRWDREGAE